MNLKILMLTNTFEQNLTIPLVLQTYKVGAAFITGWAVLLFNVPFSFTPWSFVSGLFMVPGGTAGYFAVRRAGLAVSQGIWSSLKVWTAFVWGLFIFHEPVRSTLGATAAVILLMSGLAGMSYYAAPIASSHPEEQPLLEGEEDNEESEGNNACCLTGKYVGMLGAVVDGAYGGSVLVPMHYASKDQTTQGLGYVISFGIGCSTVLAVVWFLRWIVMSIEERSFVAGFGRLPSLHVGTIGPYATFSGVIWSIGNVSSILTVAMLGQGVGYSIVQSQLLIGGLWGVFYYREITGRDIVAKWFFFAIVTVSGILWLSQEHSMMSMTAH